MPDNNGVQYSNPPQSRNEAILEDTINGVEYTDPPQSRIESLLKILNALIIAGAGTGGTVVIANPELEGDEGGLSSIQIGNTKYNLAEISKEYKSALESGVSVKDYGATGDGETDDSQAFVDAMEAASAAENPVILIPKGTYDLNNTSMNIDAFVFIGENPEDSIILNSNITAPHGITCLNVTFNGGTARRIPDDMDANINGSEMILNVTPEYDGATVLYKNCIFRNADIGSVAYWGTSESAKPLVENVIEGCTFENFTYCGVYHSVDMTNAICVNSTFKNIGNNTITDGKVLGICLGDITQGRHEVADAVLDGNTFDTLISAYDTSGNVHVINHNAIAVDCDRATITHNTIKDVIGYGTDREAIYTKGNDVEVAFNHIENGGSGEGYICCKPKEVMSDARMMLIHDNTLEGEFGTGMHCYGSGRVYNNTIAIKKLKRAIYFLGANQSTNLADCYNNHIISGTGPLTIGGEEQTSYKPEDIISFVTGYPAGIRVNNNFISIKNESGYNKSFNAVIKVQLVQSNIEILNNTVYECNASNGIALATGSTTPSVDTNVEIAIKNNYFASVSGLGIYTDMSNNSHVKLTYFIMYNVFASVGTYAVNLASASNNNDIVHYESSQPQNAFGTYKHIFTATVKYIYSMLGTGFFLAPNTTLVSSNIRLYLRRADFKAVVADSSDFADFQTKVAAL